MESTTEQMDALGGRKTNRSLLRRNLLLVASYLAIMVLIAGAWS